MSSRCLAGAAFGACVTSTVVAWAEPMDPATERLVRNADACVDADGRIGSEICDPDHMGFKRLVSQYGMAIAPSAMHSARTTGFGGFHVSVEALYTTLDSGAEYMERGTQGSDDTLSRNENPASVLQVYSAKVRKSFGFGFEVTGALGFVPRTRIVTGGADIRLSLFEGFREEWPGYIPDLAVGGGVRTITGTSAFSLTVAGLDAQLSKPIPIADSSILIPTIGYQYLWIFGDSGLVDLTPGTDPLGACRFVGPNVPGTPGASAPYDGQPVCASGSSEDFNNNVVFENARLERQRILVGLAYRYEPVMVGVQLMTDVVSPGKAQQGGETTVGTTTLSDGEVFEDEDPQWTIAIELGAIF